MDVKKKKFQINDRVYWLGNSYKIVEFDNKQRKAILKQLFSLGIVLNGYIDIDELEHII